MNKKLLTKRLLAILLLALSTHPVLAQISRQVALANGASIALMAPAEPSLAQKMNTLPQAEGRYFWLAHAANLPQLENAVRQSKALTIEYKVAPGIFMLGSTKKPAAADLYSWGIDGIGWLNGNQKMSRQLREGIIPGHARTNSGQVSFLISTYPSVNAAKVSMLLRQQGFETASFAINQAGIYKVVCSESELMKLADLPFVSFLQPIPPADQTLNQRSRSISRSSSLNAPLAQGGRNLQGKDVVVGVGDDTDPSLHPDLMDRIINYTPGIVNNHGAHVTGTVAGAGIILPQYAGYAPKASVLSQWFSGIWLNAPLYVPEYNMVVTNNSYGAVVGDCEQAGGYDLTSVLLDDQVQQFPQLLNVFASGNDGGLTCAPFPNSYGTVLKGYQSAKNIITVGRLGLPNLIAVSSSSGPVKDGRLKPEIIALGGGMISTRGQFSIGIPYYSSDGTSMSSPGVTGGLTLLYERYRQLHGNANPNGSLMKALLLNGALDMGTPGPDFRYGYGAMHLENSMRMLETNTYTEGSVVQNQHQDVVITVPAGAAALKVLIYWHDPAANVLATKTLVNDLDLQVIGPNGTTLPLILNSSAAQVTNAAVPGIDRANNSEQVVISNPQAGSYTIRITGFDVMVNAPQAYAMAYDLVQPGTKISVPFAGESWASGQAVHISWDFNGTPGNSFTLDYSLDNGGTWTNISSTIPDADRFYSWTAPADAATTQAKLRLTRNGTSETFTTGNFTIIGRPTNSLAPVADQCEGYIKINWTAVTGADGYEVMLKQGPEMVSVASLPIGTLTHTLSGLSRDSTYYVAIRATLAGQKGWWNTAVERRPNNGNCNGSISDGDLSLDSIAAPISGRQFTNSALGASTDLKIRVRNLDNADATAFTLSYSINGAPLTDVPVTTTIAGAGNYVHTISGLDLSAPGDYTLLAIVKNTAATDNVARNDTFRTTIRHLPNVPISLANTFAEGFEGLPQQTVQRNTLGLQGSTYWDYAKTDPYDRLRTRATSNVAHSGNRAITLDVSKATPYAVNPANNLIGVFNLSNYTTTNDVRLDFWFQQHGVTQVANAQNKVWARGSEANNWIEVYDLGKNQPMLAGTYKQTISIELTDSLIKYGQEFSPSTQIRFGQRALYGMGDLTTFAGYSFDDVQLYQAVNDVQVLALDAPALTSCALTDATTISMVVRNSMNATLTNIPVSYSINGGAPVNAVIASIAANTTVLYTFATTANLSATGIYFIAVSANMPNDNVPNNNSVTSKVVNQPSFSSFPYFQNFEGGAAFWFAEGTNSSWAFGTPASSRINRAASGTKVWKTNLTGNYNDAEMSYLYSPCFNINALSNPTISFSMAYDIEDCRSTASPICDAAWLEYSYDGKNWQKLGTYGQGTNWYDYQSGQVWMKSNQTHWHVASADLPKQPGNIRLRFAFSSDDATTREGVAIDDIHIFDNTTPIYVGPTNTAAINQTVSGNSFVHFIDAGRLVASINPNGNNLGLTEVKAYFAPGMVRNNGEQYFANRNITIKPTNDAPATAVTVRLYFTDVEVEEMRNATGCIDCTPSANYTRMNITKYSDDIAANEDGSLLNNTTGVYRSIVNANITFYPFGYGYYADFPVTSFSEFWITDGNFNIVLPAKWVSFDALKEGANIAKLLWQTANESQVMHYEPEVMAPGRNSFVSLGIVGAKNSISASYSFTDSEPNKAGTHLYRIKQTDKDGKVAYSATKSLFFGTKTFNITTYPNPAVRDVQVHTDGATPALLQWKITDVSGRMALQGKHQMANADEKWRINLQSLPPGVYQLTINQQQFQYQTKLVKVIE